jgi:hypothetical protein
MGIGNLLGADFRTGFGDISDHVERYDPHL